MIKKKHMKEQREILLEAKDAKLQIRLNSKLRERYEATLRSYGISMTDHLTIKILEFCQLAEDEKKKALHKK